MYWKEWGWIDVCMYDSSTHPLPSSLTPPLTIKTKTGLALFAQVLQAKKDHLVAGAVARGVMISSLYPVDTVKTRVQMFGAAEGLKVRAAVAVYVCACT